MDSSISFVYRSVADNISVLEGTDSDDTSFRRVIGSGVGCSDTYFSEMTLILLDLN